MPFQTFFEEKKTNDKSAESRVITVIFQPKNCHLQDEIFQIKVQKRRPNVTWAHRW